MRESRDETLDVKNCTSTYKRGIHEKPSLQQHLRGVSASFFFLLTVAHGLSELLGHSLEVAQGDVPGLVVVEQVEHLQ